MPIVVLGSSRKSGDKIPTPVRSSANVSSVVPVDRFGVRINRDFFLQRVIVMVTRASVSTARKLMRNVFRLIFTVTTRAVVFARTARTTLRVSTVISVRTPSTGPTENTGTKRTCVSVRY